MAKEWAKGFYDSRAWQDCRAAYILHKHGLCERCDSPGIIVHHKEELSPFNIDDPEVTLNWDNLELLCQDCHNKVHHGSGEVVGEGLTFDEHGDLIQTRTPPHKN